MRAYAPPDWSQAAYTTPFEASCGCSAPYGGAAGCCGGGAPTGYGSVDWSKSALPDAHVADPRVPRAAAAPPPGFGAGGWPGISPSSLLSLDFGGDEDLCSREAYYCVYSDPPAYGDLVCYTCPCYVDVEPVDARIDDAPNSSQDEIDTSYAGMSDLDYAEGTSSGAAVNGTVLLNNNEANGAHPDVWFAASVAELPPDLGPAYWDSRFFSLNSAVYWTFVHVSQDGSHCQSGLLTGNYSLAVDGAYICSGVQPYVAYQVLSRGALYGGHVWRVRVWLGLTHHFSFFAPPPDSSTAAEPYTTDVLLDYSAYGGTMWGLYDTSDPSSGDVDNRGRLADMFTSLIDRASFQINIPHRERIVQFTYVYSCDPRENYADPDPNGWAQDSYQSGDWNGLPAPNAFSDPWAKDETSDTQATMTAFLGASSWGDACIFTNESDTPAESVLARKAFEMLYGDWVSAAYQLKARGATSPSDPDVVVNRWFRLDATMLQRVQTVRAGIETLRSTDYGKYLYREWDSARMREDGQKSKGQGCACRDAKALPVGSGLPGSHPSIPRLGS